MCARPRPAHAPLSDAEFAELLVANMKLVFSLVRRRLPPELLGLADDVGQTALLSCWRCRRSFDPHRPTANGRPPFAAWVVFKTRAVVEWTMDTRARRLARLDATGHGPAGVASLDAYAGEPADRRRTDPAEVAERAEVMEMVGQAVDRLPPPQRDAVVGRLGGVKFATLTGGAVTRQAVEHRRKAGIRRLRAELAPALGAE